MNFLEMLKGCLNPKVVLSALVAIALAYVFAPQLAHYSWILIALVCPLSMMLMMAMMNHGDSKGKERLYSCPECNMDYSDPDWAKKCAAWCKEHKSCNLDIIRHAVQKSD